MKVLKFSASWCGPCQMLKRVLEDVESPVPIEEIDIDENTDMTIKYGVRGVPTCILINDIGGEERRRSGLMSEKEFLEFVKL